MSKLYWQFEPDGKQKPETFDINETLTSAISEFEKRFDSYETYEMLIHPETLETYRNQLNTELQETVKLTPQNFGSKFGVKILVGEVDPERGLLPLVATKLLL